MRKKFSDSAQTTPEDMNILGKSVKDALQELDGKILQVLSQLKEKRGTEIYPLFLRESSIDMDTIDDVFNDLRTSISCPNARLDVILDSSGGDIHAAYNLARLFQRRVEFHRPPLGQKRSYPFSMRG